LTLSPHRALAIGARHRHRATETVRIIFDLNDTVIRGLVARRPVSGQVVVVQQQIVESAAHKCGRRQTPRQLVVFQLKNAAHDLEQGRWYRARELVVSQSPNAQSRVGGGDDTVQRSAEFVVLQIHENQRRWPNSRQISAKVVALQLKQAQSRERAERRQGAGERVLGQTQDR